ncbi:hypothetical protein INT45_005494, partial [Circinella minor]
GLAEACSVTLSWEVTNEDIAKVQILLDKWHIFAMEKLEHNLYTSVMHYLRHIPQALKYLGPTRAYSTRPSERIISVYSRLIKSKSSPASNAANVMMRLSAIREYQRQKDDLENPIPASTPSCTTTTSATGTVSILSTVASCIMDDTITEENRRKKVYALSTNEAAPELWEVLKNYMDFDQIEEEFGISNLDGLVKYFWKRIKGVVVPFLVCQSVVIDKKLLQSGCIYDSKFYLDKRSKRPTTLVKLTLPVNVYARSTQRRSELVWREFFGEVLLFFSHKFNDGTEKILALVKIFTLIKLTVHGMPCGPPPDDPRHSKHCGK